MSPTLHTSQIGDVATTTIGYGTMGFGGMAYGQADTDEARFKVLDQLYAMGERNIDSASIYGDAEATIGKWLALHPEYRSSLFIATKFGFTPQFTIRGDAEFVRASAEEALKKLQVDTIDLFYQHRPDKNTPIEVTMRALKELVEEGKIKYIGLSDCTPDTIRRAQKIHPVTAVQIEYSPLELFHEDPKVGLIPVCKELGIALVAYSPTGRGILTGRYNGPEDFPADDFRAGLPKFNKENFPKVLAISKNLARIGESHPVNSKPATAAQIALAWVKSQGFIVLPGAKTMKYVEENLAADSITLSESEIKDIRAWAEELDWANKGAKYGPGLEELGGVDTPLEK